MYYISGNINIDLLSNDEIQMSMIILNWFTTVELDQW